jgi:hypothetical protein
VKSAYQFSFIFLLILLFLAEFFHPISAINVDLGRHLLLGKIIATTHHIPKTNLISYTYPNFPYINTSGLTDVIYYLLFVVGGFDLLLIVNTILIAFAIGILGFYFTKKHLLTEATLFGITLYLLLLGLRPDIRPEVMSMVCLAFFMIILNAAKRTNKGILLFLIPIELLWVNLHIYFFVGPLLIFLFLFDHLITNHFKFAKAKFYYFALVGTIAVTIINPNGLPGAVFPFTVLSNYGLPVAENQSLLTLFSIYHSSEIILSFIAVIMLFAILFLTRDTKPIDWLLAVVFSLAAIFFFRNILLFVFTTFPIFVEQLNLLLEKYQGFIKKLPRISYVLIYPLSLLFVIILIFTSIRVNGFGFGVRAYGKNAVDFLIAHRISGPIYNNFDIGDYLSYRLYPKQVFVDNRPEAYPATFFQNIYNPMQKNPLLFTKLDSKYYFNTIVISYWDNTPWGYPLVRYLINKSNFKLIYLDQYNIILVRDTRENKDLIKQYSVKQKDLHVTEINPQELVHYLFFYEKVGWKEQELATLNLMKKDDPEHCILTQYPITKTFLSSYITKHNLMRNCSGLLSDT